MLSCRYKVFLSFRGTDTRNTFVGHLYKELCNKGIYTFKDDPKLKRGESISAILDTIQDSRSSLVILSQDYASSTWCLDELFKIIECREREDLKQIVVPVFYNVDPSDVGDIKGTFKDALDLHEANFAKDFRGNDEKYKEAMQKLQNWKEALIQVANLSGWDSQHSHRDEATFIKQIVRDISDKLSCESSSDVTDLVGMCSHVRKMDQLLHVEKKVVRMVGIWGIDGIGKTKIARVMYDKLFRQFDAGCFIDNVRDKFKKHGGSTLKKELLSKTLLEKNLDLWPLDRDSNVIKDKLVRTKVLIVVDDVDELEQLEVLVKPDWFGLGSRIIITTQHKQLLVAHGINAIYEVPFLEHDQALQLFCRYAFKQNQPKEDYLELSNGFLSYVNGLPLALKVLGSFLYGKKPREWQSELDKLGTYSNKTIQDLLEIGYNGLEDMEKRAFLDIACFFNGENEHFVKSILDGCGFFANRTLRVLKDKAMITTSDNKLFMHELLQEMGREIVRKESEEYCERSRLWKHDHIDPVLTKPKDTGIVEGIFFNAAKMDEIQIHPQAFTGLHKLRLLKFYNLQSFAQKCNVQLAPEGLSSLSEVLRFLDWPEYPMKSLPVKFCPKYLVELNLPYSSIQRLWSGKQPLVNLKSVDLNHSNLMAIPDLSEAQKLRRLNLQGCTNLVEVSSIENLTKLQYLNFKDCESLRNLPNMIKLKLLQTLDLSNCWSLEKIFQLPANIKYLYLVHTAIQELPLPIGCRWSLIELDLRDCTRLVNLPQEIFNLNSLRNLNIAGCPHLLGLLTGVEMEIENEEEEEEEEEDIKGEVGKMESAELEMQESSGDFGDEYSDDQVDMCSKFHSYHGCQKIERNINELVSTGMSSKVDIPAPNVLYNPVPSSEISKESIHVFQKDLYHVSIAANTNRNGDPELDYGCTVCHQAGITQAVSQPISLHKAKDITGVVGKENRDKKAPSIEPPSTPVNDPQRDMNFVSSIAETTSIICTQAKSKRAFTKKAAISSKKRRLEDEKSQPSRKSIPSTVGTAANCKRSSCAKLAASKKKRSKVGSALPSKTTNTSKDLKAIHQVAENENVEEKEKESSEMPSHFGVSYQQSMVLEVQCLKETSQLTIQRLSDNKSAFANEPTQSAEAVVVPRSLFADLAATLGRGIDNSVTRPRSYVGCVTSSAMITSTTNQLKNLLEIGLQELVHTNRLKEAVDVINTLEKEKNLFSKEQRACMMLLKKLEQWGNSFQESEEKVTEATRMLELREEMKEKLEKAYNEYKQVREELNKVTSENEETKNCLVEVRQQREEAWKKLEELKDEENCLSEKMKLQQNDLKELSQKHVELDNATGPLLHEYNSQDEKRIRDSLNVAERKIAEVGEAYKKLQASFSSFS